MSGLEWRPLAPCATAASRASSGPRRAERRVVCKDGSALSRWTPLGLYRRLALRREARILQRLAGVAGVPGVLAHWPGAWSWTSFPAHAH
jgi:hypothetical protein